MHDPVDRDPALSLAILQPRTCNLQRHLERLGVRIDRQAALYIGDGTADQPQTQQGGCTVVPGAPVAVVERKGLVAAAQRLRVLAQPYETCAEVGQCGCAVSRTRDFGQALQREFHAPAVVTCRYRGRAFREAGGGADGRCGGCSVTREQARCCQNERSDKLHRHPLLR